MTCAYVAGGDAAVPHGPAPAVAVATTVGRLVRVGVAVLSTGGVGVVVEFAGGVALAGAPDVGVETG